jgi:pimeloyl-ACP methyl ester carboxylesterase
MEKTLRDSCYCSEAPRELAVNEYIAETIRSWRLRPLRSGLRRSKQFTITLIELAELLVSPVFWGRAPRGDGHSVLVIPGYAAGDFAMTLIRNWLRRVGYRPIESGLNANPGWSEEIVQALGDLAESQFLRSARRVTLIGHSLGGLQARSVAQRRPHAVRQVIALGAPLVFAGGALAPSVAVSSIYTSSDLGFGFEPRACESHAENVQVRGTHDALVLNRRVYRLIARLLRRPDSHA